MAGSGRVAGIGGKPLTAVPLKDYTTGLTFLSAKATVDGGHGQKALVGDCSGRASLWQATGKANLDDEKETQREDPGSCIGNPMATDDLKNFRGATNKEARMNGEHSLSASAVTPEVMCALHREMWVRHMPAVAAPVDDAESVTTPAPEVSEQPRAYTPPSDADADELNYVFYVMLFFTLGRPVKIMDLKFEDVFFPDIKMAENQEFFNRYVALGSYIRIVFEG